MSVLVDPPLNAGWLVFMHTSDGVQMDDMKMTVADAGRGGFRGEGRLNEHAANYVVIYEDGSEERAPVRRRHQVGMYQRHWGENCFEAVARINRSRCARLTNSCASIGAVARRALT